MRIFVTLMMMVMFVTMTVSVASADLSVKSCSSQIRADDMCYATALPVTSSEGARKGGVCCDFFLTAATLPVGPQAQVHRFFTIQTLRSGLVVPAPFRPPRV